MSHTRAKFASLGEKDSFSSLRKIKDIGGGRKRNKMLSYRL